MKIFMSILLGILVPAHAIAHGAGEHAHDGIGVIEVAIGLCIIVAIALVWAIIRAMGTRKK